MSGMKSLVLITVLLTASKGFRLEGPSGPLVAQLGGSVLLPCSAETPLPLEELEVEWKRSDSESLVHLFQEGEERPESQDYAYMGRAHFLSDELVRGNYSIVLNNVTEGDAGVYICKVYTDLDHSSITAEIYFGYSKLHSFILALCSISLVFSIGLIFWMYFHWKDTSQKALRIHFVLFLCPNILLGIGFITWGVIEGFLGEAVACSTVNFIRFLLLIKTAPYLNSLPGCFKGFKTFSATAVYSVVTVIVFSVVFKNTQLNTDEKFLIGLLLGLIWMSYIIAFTLAALRGFEPSSQPARPREVVHLDPRKEEVMEGAFVELGTFFAIMLLFIQSTTASWERFGLMTVVALLQFLTPMTHLDHPKEVPETCHVIVYLLGASGLSIVNSVTLMTELILKAGTGKRNIADLRVIVLLAESFFICAWMPFELYDAWKRNKHRGQRTPNQRAQSSQMPPQGQEIEALSHPSAHP